MNTLPEFQREGDQILRKLALALEQALLGFNNPKPAAAPFERRYTKLKKDMDAFGTKAPHAADYVEGFLKLLRKQMDELIRRAKRAHNRRNEVESGYQQDYNKFVGKTLGSAPGQAKNALSGQVERLLRKMIDQSLPSGKVPAHVKGTMARELTRWVESQEAVEDAYFIVESSVMEIAAYLHERLTIKGEIDLTRKTLIKDPEITQGQADAADKRVGELAKRASKLDAEIARRIERATLRVKGNFSFKPRLVLDPAKHFIRDVEVKAGIRISQNNVKVDLGTNLRVLSPTTKDRTYEAGAFARTQVGNNFDFKLSGSVGFNNQGDRTDYKVKASLSYRF
ncbi:MAG: hypothetical protein JKY65_19510 [Planctomycetes bacterium]|nr:hypothetical protein [Planctomycetota bacterium]